MTTAPFLERCRLLASEFGFEGSGQVGHGPETTESDSLIGFFQLFRPDGRNLEGLFDALPIGDQLSDRLQSIFEATENDRRPQGGRDVYFIVRSPSPLTAESAAHLGADWIEGLKQIAESVGDRHVGERLATKPKIRVLEGIPPKHPKQLEERSELLTVISHHAVGMTEKITGVDPHAELLRPAYYFMACDAMLRDYLMWPFYARQTGLADPLASYFSLWRHGVKFRIFGEDQVDLYLPRHAQA